MQLSHSTGKTAAELRSLLLIVKTYLLESAAKNGLNSNAGKALEHIEEVEKLMCPE
jgi:hypothetical protein